MRTYYYFATLLALLSGLYVCAEEPTVTSPKSNPDNITSSYAGKFGAGIIIGEPTGASLKYWLNDTLAIDGAAGWSLHDHTDFYLHSDLLWHKLDLIPVPRGRLAGYVGAGGLVRFRNDHYNNEFGVRVPVGVSYMFDNAPVDVFAEIAPALDVAPDARGEITGGIGIRYWF